MVFCKNHAVSRCCVPNQILIVSCFFLFSFSFLTFQVENESIRIRTQESLFNGLNMWSFSARPEWKQRDARNILPAVVQQEADKKKKKKKSPEIKGSARGKNEPWGISCCALCHMNMKCNAAKTDITLLTRQQRIVDYNTDTHTHTQTRARARAH